VVPYSLVGQHYRENCCLLFRRLIHTGKIHCRVQKLQWSWDYYGPHCQSQSTLSSTCTIFNPLISLLKMEAPGSSRKLVPVYQNIWCHHRRVYIQQEIQTSLVIWMIKISITIISKEDKMLEYTIKMEVESRSVFEFSSFVSVHCNLGTKLMSMRRPKAMQCFHLMRMIARERRLCKNVIIVYQFSVFCGLWLKMQVAGLELILLFAVYRITVWKLSTSTSHLSF